MTRILVTGSRNWSDADAILDALAPYMRPGTTLVHGACPTGADRLAALVAEASGITVEAHPAAWETHGKAAGPLRNQAMVDLGADVCLAFPLGESRGTRDCMRRAARAGIEVVVFAPQYSRPRSHDSSFLQ